MEARGYPVGDFEQRVADISVDHAGVVHHYRAAHRIAVANAEGAAETEDLSTPPRSGNQKRERLITDATLAKLPDLDDDELRSTIRELGELEQEVSQQRRELHRVIDRMEADLATRHKVGQA